MSRSIWKGPYSSPRLREKIAEAKQGSKKKEIKIKTKDRSSSILPEYIDQILAIHNGKDWIEVKIGQEHVGHKLGEFSPSKKVAVYKRKKRK